MGLFMRPRAEGQVSVIQRAFESADAALAARSNTARTAAPVTFDSSLSLSAVWGCGWLLADLVSTLPVDVFRTVGGVDTPMPTPPVLISPAGDGIDIAEWLAATQLSLELRGNAYGIVLAWNSFGLPQQVQLVHPDTVEVRKRSTGEIVYRIAGKVFEAREVWHEKARALPGALVGQSVITAAARSMGVGIAAEQFGSDWFLDGAHPTQLFQNKTAAEPNPQQSRAFKERVMAATRGNREPLVLGSGWEIQQLQVAPGESQFIETQHVSAQHVCRFFGVPPEMIGESSGGSNITYANVEQRMLNFLTTCLNPRLIRRERALSTLLPRPQFVKLNRGALLATDARTRWAIYQTAVQNKIMSQDEIRELEDRLPLSEEQKAQLLELGSGPSAPTNGAQPDPVLEPAPAPPALPASTGA